MTSSPATLDPGDAPLAPRKEPLDTVLDLGGREESLVFTVALVAALAVHAVAGARAARSFPYLRELAGFVRSGMQDRLRSQVDIDMNVPEPPKPEPPPPEPDPEPPPPAAQAKAPEPQAPPAAAEAGKVLTADPDPDAPVDFGNEFVSGDGDRFAGGVTASAGTSKTAVRDTAAVPTGVGTGTPKATVVAAPKVDLSRAPSVVDQSACDRLYPSEAEAEGINFMKVSIAVTVSGDGRAKSVTVLKDPGFGFGKAARSCAMRMSYKPALNATGQAVEQTFSFNVRFVR